MACSASTGAPIGATIENVIAAHGPSMTAFAPAGLRRRGCAGTITDRRAAGGDLAGNEAARKTIIAGLGAVALSGMSDQRHTDRPANVVSEKDAERAGLLHPPDMLA